MRSSGGAARTTDGSGRRGILAIAVACARIGPPGGCLPLSTAPNSGSSTLAACAMHGAGCVRGRPMMASPARSVERSGAAGGLRDPASLRSLGLLSCNLSVTQRGPPPNGRRQPHTAPSRAAVETSLSHIPGKAWWGRRGCAWVAASGAQEGSSAQWTGPWRGEREIFRRPVGRSSGVAEPQGADRHGRSPDCRGGADGTRRSRAPLQLV